MSKSRISDADPKVPAETPYLIDDVEELVSGEIDALLANQPFAVKVKLLHVAGESAETSSQPRGLDELEGLMQSHIPGAREFVGTDLDFVFPIQEAIENPLNMTLRWSDGSSCLLAFTGIGPILLVQKPDESPAGSYRLSAEEMARHLKAIGLPDSLWGSDFKTLLSDIHSSAETRFERVATHILDHNTSVTFRYSALYKDLMDRGLQDSDQTKATVQELAMEVEHFSDDLQYIDFRNVLRFEHDDESMGWKYRGSYTGKVTTGELLGENVHVDPRLGIPSSRLLDKAIGFLRDARQARL